MKILISSQGQNSDGPIDDRFGRCPWLIKYDTETNQIEALENPGFRQSGGAGIAAAQFVIDQAADVVISGDFGPHAARAFEASDTKMCIFNGDISTVQQAVDSFLQGKLPVFQ
ncbi:MAG: NifB/NifX family molybdenum-iron cluster-binding protein [Anaerolineaceae bacterium]|jgi:predicted Fe-Mo cluster-binding NifX family protein|nr:NifB/NifX family molybdenum-iron cluster-binding protein [Anaerolineaceae bacterium]